MFGEKQGFENNGKHWHSDHQSVLLCNFIWEATESDPQQKRRTTIFLHKGSTLWLTFTDSTGKKVV